MNKRTIKDLEPTLLKGKRVLMRVDLNVPQRADLSISDDSRIRAVLPTIEYLRAYGARVVLVSHLGRPGGKFLSHLSLAPVAVRLSELIGQRVEFFEDCLGADVVDGVNGLTAGQVCLLENVRFHGGEEVNDPAFARALAELADIYVNDAFATAHRAHASTEGVARLVKPALAGLLMAAELKALLAIRDNPARPFACVIGGAKVSTKIGVLERLIDRLDTLVIGGAMAFTFLKAAGSKVGRSLVEDNRIDFCRQLINEAERQRVKLILPEDVVCAAKLQPGVTTIIVKIDSIPDDEMGLDLGPQTMGKIKQVLKTARTIFWNGPLGAFETPEFARATFELIDLLGDLTQSGCTTVVGGGDSVAALELKGDVSPGAFSHVSTGGGASLELIEGRLLPGVVCLDERASAVPS